SGQPASVASDIYALGVLFHVMLTGRVPARRKAPPAPQTLDTNASTAPLGCSLQETEWEREIEVLPAPWNKVVRKCLAPRPEQRYSSVDEVAAAFEQKRTPPRWMLVAALLSIALAVTMIARSHETPGPAVRLAVLPIAVQGAPIATANG